MLNKKKDWLKIGVDVFDSVKFWFGCAILALMFLACFHYFAVTVGYPELAILMIKLCIWFAGTWIVAFCLKHFMNKRDKKKVEK